MVLMLWGGALFTVVWLATGGDVSRSASPWKAQLVGLLLMTVPFTLYHAICESSRWRASLGKRVCGLVVVRETGEALSFRAALVRNAIKFIPWELGHTVAHQAACSGERGLELWTWCFAVVAFAGPLWWVVAIFRTGRSPYDRWSGARVSRARRDDDSSTDLRQPRN